MARRLALAMLLLVPAGCGRKAPLTRPATPPAPAPSARQLEGAAPAGLSRGVVELEEIPWAGAGSAGALLGVAAVAPGEALAVGEPGVLYVSGREVRIAPLPDGIPTAVWADGPAFAVVVGYGGISHVRAGGPDARFRPVPTGTDADLLAVWGRGGGASREVFAGGAGGTVLRLAPDAASWEALSAPGNVQVSAFAGNAAGVWALGESGGGGTPGDGVILRFEAGAFVDACPDLACGSAIYGGFSPAPRELWTAGARGAIVRYLAGQPEWIGPASRENLGAIWGTGTADLFVVGDAGTCLHHDGAGWRVLDAGTADLRAIDGLPSGEAWVVASDGTILHIAAPPPGG